MTAGRNVPGDAVPVDPDVAALIAELGVADCQTTPTLEEVRAGSQAQFSLMRGCTEPELAAVAACDGSLGGIRCRWYGRSPHAGSDVVVLIHGGGWVAGDIETYDPDARYLARTLDITVVSLGYRLAPETPFPGPMNDCVRAVRAAAELPHRQMAIVGDSAGGNLALVTAVAVRAEITVDALLLLYPVVDPEALDHGSAIAKADGYLLTRHAMVDYWNAYAPEPSMRLDPAAAPLRGELCGLPPTVVATAGYDPLHDQGRMLAARLVKDDVECEYLPNPSLIHGFQQQVPRVPAATLALRRAYLRLGAILRDER